MPLAIGGPANCSAAVRNGRDWISGVPGVPAWSNGSSRGGNSVAEPVKSPVAEIVPALGWAIASETQSRSSTKGAQRCQASSTSAASSHGQVTVQITTSPIGCTRKVKAVAIPKFPPPPPRNAQKRSGCSSSLARSTRPSASTSSTANEVVAGEPKLAREKADATAESQAGDADARAGAGGDGDAMLPQATIAIEQANPGADDRLAARHVDVDVGQSTHVDHETAVDYGERFIAMPSGASPQRHSLLARPADGVLHILRVVADDNGRRKAREAGVEALPSLFVVRILRPDDAAGQGSGLRP